MNGSFSPIMEGVEASRFYEVMNRQQALTADQNMDSWDRFFTFSKQMYLQGMDIMATLYHDMKGERLVCVMEQQREKKAAEK